MGGGRWHQVGSVEGVAEFVHPLVYGFPGFYDVHEVVLVYRSYPIEAGGFGEGEVMSESGEPGGIQPVATSKYNRS